MKHFELTLVFAAGILVVALAVSGWMAVLLSIMGHSSKW
jgi:hypothetical protein